MQMLEYAEALLDGKRPRIGIHEAMDLTLPGLVSQESIQRNGEWLPVPDSREWTKGSSKNIHFDEEADRRPEHDNSFRGALR